MGRLNASNIVTKWFKPTTVAVIKENGSRAAYGYQPGRLFDPGALRQGFTTNQALPWYSVTGPGVKSGQPPGIQGGQVMLSKVYQTFSAYGPGVASGETLQQQLLVPPVTSSTSSSL